MDERIDEILEFWFEDIDEDTHLAMGSPIVDRWFQANDEFDNEIRKNFEKDVKKARKGKLGDWRKSARGRLALVLLLDQFPRNIYRGTAQAFDTDIIALEICLTSIREGEDQDLSYVERQFLYLPMMHSENIEVQKESLKYFEELRQEAEESEDINLEYFANVVEFAQRHLDIIEQFKRFPHRNKSLGRKSTSEERSFLETAHSSF